LEWSERSDVRGVSHQGIIREYPTIGKARGSREECGDIVEGKTRMTEKEKRYYHLDAYWVYKPSPSRLWTISEPQR